MIRSSLLFNYQNLDFHPLGAHFRRLHDRFDKLHAAHAVFNLREIESQRIGFTLLNPGSDGVGEVQVVVCKRFQECLRMAEGNTRATGGRRTLGSDVAVAAAPDLNWAVNDFDVQIVRVFLMPLDALGFAIDPDGKVVLLADRNLAGVQKSLGAVVKAQEQLPSSSSWRPWTKVERSARISLIFRPVMYSARLAACVPISPMQPATPLCLGSVRQAACCDPERSMGLISQPCGYCTTTLITLPRSPCLTMSRASLTIG